MLYLLNSKYDVVLNRSKKKYKIQIEFTLPLFDVERNIDFTSFTGASGEVSSVSCSFLKVRAINLT